MEELHKSIVSAIFLLEEAGHKKEAKDLLLAFIKISNDTGYGLLNKSRSIWNEIDINPTAIMSGE